MVAISRYITIRNIALQVCSALILRCVDHRLQSSSCCQELADGFQACDAVDLPAYFGKTQVLCLVSAADQSKNRGQTGPSCSLSSATLHSV